MTRCLENIGINPYDVEQKYNVNSVVIYTLSSLLKSRNISCQTIADLLHVSYRTANRYKYCSFNYNTNLNLNYVFKLLDYLKFNVSLFFNIVDNFIKYKKYVIFFIKGSYQTLTKEDWECYSFDTENLEKILNSRRKAMNNKNLNINLKEYSLMLNQYPSQMIKLMK